MIGAVATVVTGKQPGTLLGAAVLAGTVVAALTILPRAGRLIFPVPALSYLIAALAAGVIYDRSADRTTLAVDATQWIASGFFLMVLATVLAIVIVGLRWLILRWLMQRRAGRDQGGPDWTRPGRPEQDAGRWGDSGTPPTQQMPRPPLLPGSRGNDQFPGTQGLGPRPDQPSARPPGWPGPGVWPGPYNFSSGA